MTALAFHGVACARRGTALFADLSFALSPGDAALVTGPNGIGKSSLIRIAAGLLAPAAGRIVRDGDCALLGEAHALDPERRLGDALGFWARLDGGRPALAALGLASVADAPVRILSTGQRRRGGIARVVASGAPIWLLDEPANGLDAAGIALLERLVAEHRRTGGIVLAATHLPLSFADAVTIDLAAHRSAVIARPSLRDAGGPGAPQFGQGSLR